MSVRSRSARLSLAANAGSRSSGYAVASCRVTLPITPRRLLSVRMEPVAAGR